jgi:hypothetical protein
MYQTLPGLPISADLMPSVWPDEVGAVYYRSLGYVNLLSPGSRAFSFSPKVGADRVSALQLKGLSRAHTQVRPFLNLQRLVPVHSAPLAHSHGRLVWPNWP